VQETHGWSWLKELQKAQRSHIKRLQSYFDWNMQDLEVQAKGVWEQRLEEVKAKASVRLMRGVLSASHVTISHTSAKLAMRQAMHHADTQ
jgi:hypothetical protein